MLLLLAAIAVAIAIVQLADDTDQVAQTPPAATPAPPPPTVTPAPTLTPDPALTPRPGAAGGEREGDARADARAAARADAEWPAGESGWTVVLATDSSESDAREKADELAADGIAGVGVVDSDDFSAVKPDLWVVFAGRYDSQTEAADALDGIDVKDAYIRRLEPA